MTEPQHLSVAASKVSCHRVVIRDCIRCACMSMQATCTEHAVTRDKMKELMAKFKKEREFRQALPPLPQNTAGAQLSRKGTGKVLILESRASSRLLHNSSSRVTPLSSAHANEATRVPQRKLVFPGEDTCSHLHNSGKPKKRMASCSLTSRRVRSPDETTPIISHKACSRVCVHKGTMVFPSKYLRFQQAQITGIVVLVVHCMRKKKLILN